MPHAAWLALVLLAAAPLRAQDTPAPIPLPPSVTVTGEATVTARPDQAVIDIGVVTRAEEPQVAAEQNAQKLAAVLAALRAAVAGAQIETVSYSLQPDYYYPRQAEDGEPRITGYTAMNVVRVTVDELTRVGQIIDVATEAGANQIQRVRFKLADEQALRSRALRQAAVQARAHAEALAAALGLEVGRVLSAVESGPVGVPVQDVMLARAEAAVATPIEPGTIETRATVTLTVEVNP